MYPTEGVSEDLKFYFIVLGSYIYRPRTIKEGVMQLRQNKTPEARR